MSDPNKKLFLLGGYDLEMATIKTILDQAGSFIDCIDHQLTWDTAVLSSYQSDIISKGHQYGVIYGIELRKDISSPDNYINIDHHNELSHLPSSIEQVAEILEFPLTRYHKLVAANDRAYIPGLLEMGATDKEISDIRKQDRAAQGVLQEDERLAEVSICNSEVVNDVKVIHALTDKFSAITDRLFGKTNGNLLIYTERKLNFYGPAVRQLVWRYHQLIVTGKAYSGGNPLGFFGIANGELNTRELFQIRDEIIAITGNSKS